MSGFSRTNIANLSFSLLETPAVSNVDTDDSPAAELIRSVWDAVRDLALCDHTWNFALKRWTDRAPVPAVQNPAAEVWENAFSKPADCLRVLQVNPDRDNKGDRFNVEGELVLVDASLVTLRGIARITQPGKYSVWFVEYFAARLALRIAKPLQASDAVRKSIRDEVKETLIKARGADGQEGTLDPIFANTFLAARYGDAEEWDEY